MTTTVATAAAMLAWLLTERIRDGHATTLGAASGIVAGLVAITPSCSSVNVLGALAIGAVGGVLCALAVGLKFKLGFDDSLDVVGVHLIGGLAGTLLVGLLAARRALPSTAWPVCRRACSTAAVGSAGTAGGRRVQRAVLLGHRHPDPGPDTEVHDRAASRVPRTEATGIDESEHAESGYDFATATGSVLPMRVCRSRTLTARMSEWTTK